MTRDSKTETLLPPDLLLELLEAARAAVPLREHYKTAAGVAWSVTVLRRECEGSGFKDSSLGSYLTQLVQTCDIDPQPLLDWYGIGSLHDRKPVGAICRFAREIGIAIDELVAYIFRTFAEEERKVPVPVAARGDAMDDREYAIRCAAAIEGLPWDPESRAELRQMRAEIVREYENSGS
jgi:hypothetical protein